MRALVVGHGRMGGFHARALADLGFEVVTEDPVASADVRFLPGYERRAFDAVCLAVPIRDLAREALTMQGHPGWLLVEKPFAATLDEAHAVRAALAGQRVAVGYVERFNPQAVRLKRQLSGLRATGATFIRCNTRPTADLDLDLRSHDLDLAHWLGLDPDRCRFVARAGELMMRREIYVDTAGGGTLYADLTDHGESPLHTMWRSCLAGEGQAASMDDAVRVLTRLHASRALAA